MNEDWRGKNAGGFWRMLDGVVVSVFLFFFILRVRGHERSNVIYVFHLPQNIWGLVFGRIAKKLIRSNQFSRE